MRIRFFSVARRRLFLVETMRGSSLRSCCWCRCLLLLPSAPDRLTATLSIPPLRTLWSSVLQGLGCPHAVRSCTASTASISLCTSGATGIISIINTVNIIIFYAFVGQESSAGTTARPPAAGPPASQPGEERLWCCAGDRHGAGKIVSCWSGGLW